MQSGQKNTSQNTGNNWLSSSFNMALPALKKKIIETHPTELRKQVLTVNDDGELPHDLIKKSRYSDKGKEELSNLLISYMKPKNIKSINEYIFLNTNTIESELQSNLEIGCKVANKVRMWFKSDTHPEMNDFNPDFAEKLMHDINNDRNETKIKKFKILRNSKDEYFISRTDSPKKISLNLPADIVQELFNNQSVLTQLYFRGNCEEISFWVVNELTKMGIKAELFHIENGDHVFVVLGRTKGLVHDHTTWNKEAVVIDAWAGEIYPATQIPNKLHAYRYIDKQKACINYVVPFQPNYHQINLLNVVLKNIKLKFNENNYATKFFDEYSSTMTNKEKYIFGCHAGMEYNDAVESNLFTEKDVSRLKTPVKTIIYIFTSKKYYDLLKERKITLKQFEEKKLLKKLSRNDINFFTSLNSKKANDPMKAEDTVKLNNSPK